MPAMVADDVALKPFRMAGFSASVVSNPQRTQLRLGPQVRPKRWILDVDGTLMLRRPGGRSPYDWERVSEDVPNPPVVKVVRGLVTMDVKFLIVTGRLDACREDTIQSLRDHVFFNCQYAWNSDDLFMRDEARQNMPDDELKRELFLRDIMPFYDIEGVIDDRQRVVDMWRREGLFCMQVAEGNF